MKLTRINFQLAKLFPNFKLIVFILKINFHHIYGNLVAVISLVIIGNNFQYFPFIFRVNIRPKINRNRVTYKRYMVFGSWCLCYHAPLIFISPGFRFN